MENEIPRALATGVVPRVIDLRAEFEAQLRAVARLDDQLQKTLAGKDPANRTLATVLRRELAEMLANNKNIRDVLVELESETGMSTPI